jgi:nucleoside-diphosphate-sugar epimerase
VTTPGPVAVTGGAGFLGRHLVERLAASGRPVRVLDISPAAGEAGPSGVEYHQADVGDRAAVERVLAGATAVVHAAFASPHQSGEEIDAVNVGGTRTVLDSAAAAGCRRVVLVSSTIVDRTIAPHPLSTRAPVSRLRRYRDSRVAAEAEVDSATQDHRRLRAAVARPAPFVGPGQVGGFALVFESIRRGWPVPLLGRGDHCYRLLDVRDLADGLALLADSTATGRFGFAAAGSSTAASDLGELAAHAGTGAAVRRVPGALARPALRAVELAGLPPLADWHHRSARGEDHLVDTSRSQAELGWRPSGDNIDALVAAYDWYAAQAGYGPLSTTHPVPIAHRALHRIAAGLLRRPR